MIRFWLRFWLRYIGVCIVCTILIFAFMASPYVINGWPVTDEIIYGSPIVGSLIASWGMLAMEIYK